MDKYYETLSLEELKNERKSLRLRKSNVLKQLDVLLGMKHDCDSDDLAVQIHVVEKIYGELRKMDDLVISTILASAAEDKSKTVHDDHSESMKIEVEVEGTLLKARRLLEKLECSDSNSASKRTKSSCASVISFGPQHAV